MCVYRLDAYFKTKASLSTPTIQTSVLAFISYFALFDAGNWLLRMIIYKHIYHAQKYKIPGNSRESFEEVITVLYSLTQSKITSRQRNLIEKN